MAQQIQIRRGTAAEWTSENPTLAEGEIGLETDTRRVKYGDGTTAWTSLNYAAGGSVITLVQNTGYAALTVDGTTVNIPTVTPA